MYSRPWSVWALRCTRVKAWLYKWLPIVFGCHCRPERSFHYHGQPFPICARCTGDLVGMLTAACSFGFWHPGAAVSALLLVPLVADGLVQLCTAYESKNGRRFVTGVLFGYGLLNLFLLSIVWVFHWGYALGLRWKAA